MIVMKFGGSSVESGDAILRLARIVKTHLARQPVVVVSAMGETTNKLLEFAEHARRGDRYLGSKCLDEVQDHHFEVASQVASGDGLHRIVEEVGTGNDALGLVQTHPFDLVLLDINMPGIGGIETCQRIRAQAPQIGIVMVTVRDDEEDKVRALEAGADDYVTKPFRFRELVARMGAVLRRLDPQKSGDPGVLQAGSLKMDAERRLLWKGADEVHLSPKEFDLLAFLMKNQGAPLTHTRLLRAVWGPEYGGELEYLRSYVRMLRKKL